MSMTAPCMRSKAHFNGFSLLAYLTDNEGRPTKFLDDYLSRHIGLVSAHVLIPF